MLSYYKLYLLNASDTFHFLDNPSYSQKFRTNNPQEALGLLNNQ